jgi:hypothetical protein
MSQQQRRRIASPESDRVGDQDHGRQTDSETSQDDAEPSVNAIWDRAASKSAATS